MVNNEKIIIDQCLYGYSEGHRLLSSSQKVDEKSQSELLRKSDLPSGFNFIDNQYYYTGFPLINAKSYALIKTWTAPEMNRPGCVWSHVLLIKFADFDKIHDFSDLDELFKRPNKTNDIYSDQLQLNIKCHNHHNFKYNEHKLLRILSSIYSSNITKHPIETSSPAKFINEVYYAWSIQWPKLRRSFRFTVVSNSTKSEMDFLNANDILFVFSNKDEFKDLLIEEWQYKLIYWCRADYLSLKNFLWALGRKITGGRQKFKNLIEIFDISKNTIIDMAEKNKIDLLIEKIKSTFSTQSELIFTIDYITKSIIKVSSDTQSLISISANILENFFYDDVYIPDTIKECIITKISNKEIYDCDLTRLLTNEMILSGNVITTTLLSKVSLSDLMLSEYTLRSLSEICNANSELILNDAFWSLKRRSALYLLNAHWQKIENKIKILFIKKSIANDNYNFIYFLANNSLTLLLDELIGSRLFFNYDHKKSSIEILTNILLKDISASQKLANGYNITHELLTYFDYNDFIINKINADELQYCITNHLNDLNEKEKFNFFSFLYFKAYDTNDIKQAHILFYSFIILHDLLSKGVFSITGWEILRKVLPEVSMFNSWDRCYIIRKSIMLYCNSNPKKSINLDSILAGHESLNKLKDDLDRESR